MRGDVLRDYIRMIVETSMTTRRGFASARRGMASIQSRGIPDRFLSSELVDDAGNPLIFYHGTKRDFVEFRQEMLDTSGTSIATNYIGFYFTSSPDVAKIYASKRFNPAHGTMPAGHIDPVVLDVKNPYYITEKTYWKWGRGSKEEMIDMVDRLKSLGYDAVVMPAVWRGRGRDAYDVVVFSANQIHKLRNS